MATSVSKKQKMKADMMEDKLRMSEEEEERLPLNEFYRRMSKKTLNWEEISYKLSKSDEESDSEEDKENIRRSPVEKKGRSHYVDPKFCSSGLSEDEPESDEEVLGDSDCDDVDVHGGFNFVVKKRDEIDWGFKFVVKKRWRTVTNPKVPKKTYFPSHHSGSGRRGRCRSTFPVLHDPDFPLAAVSKLALKTYNTIQNTNYRYVGLVKAYKRTVNGFFFWTRFKACLPGQDAINFQAHTLQGMPNIETNVVPVRVESVYPLPPS